MVLRISSKLLMRTNSPGCRFSFAEGVGAPGRNFSRGAGMYPGSAANQLDAAVYPVEYPAESATWFAALKQGIVERIAGHTKHPAKTTVARSEVFPVLVPI